MFLILILTISRILTFFLSCWLVCAVCCGLTVAIVAGVAYGYNYCVAEFITLSRSDVNVYMRRGQLNDIPNFLKYRRSGDDDEDFPEAYERKVPPGGDSASREWKKDQHIRKHAEKLAKHSDTRKNIVDAEQSDNEQKTDEPSRNDSVSEQWKKNQDTQTYSSQESFETTGHQVIVGEDNVYYKMPVLPPARRVSILPNPYIRTTVIRSGSSEIVMRKFEHLTNVVPNPIEEVDINMYSVLPIMVPGIETAVTNTPPLEEIERKTVAVLPVITVQLENSSTPDMFIRLVDSSTRKIIKLRHWQQPPKLINMEYLADNDEENVAFKAV